MKQGWKIKNLGEICEIVNGSTPLRTNKDFWDNGDYPWFTIDDIREQGRIINHTRQKVTNKALKKLRVLPIDTILLCCTASIGEYAITKIELTTNQQFNGLVIKDKKELLPMFLFYFSSTLKDTLSNLSGKTTIDFIPISRLKNIEIQLPPPSEQKEIIAILDKAFTDISKAKANAEQNLKNAKELFESYLQGVFSNKDNKWKEGTLGEIIEIRNGRNQKAVLSEIGKYKIMGSAGNVMGYANDYICEVGTTIIGRKGNISKPIYIDEKFWNVDTAFGLFPKNEKNTDKRFVYYLCLGIDFKSMNRGTTIPSLVKTELQTIKIVYPKSLKEQQDIVKKLDSLSIETKRLENINQQKLNYLEELRKSILQKAFNGELKSVKV